MILLCHYSHLVKTHPSAFWLASPPTFNIPLHNSSYTSVQWFFRSTICKSTRPILTCNSWTYYLNVKNPIAISKYTRIFWLNGRFHQICAWWLMQKMRGQHFWAEYPPYFGDCIINQNPASSPATRQAYSSSLMNWFASKNVNYNPPIPFQSNKLIPCAAHCSIKMHG